MKPYFSPLVASLIVLLISSPVSAVTSIQFSKATFLADEDRTPARISIERSGDTSAALTLNVSITGGTAVAGEDYAVVPAQVNFAPGETNKHLDISLLDDCFAEPDKTVTLQLTNLPDGVTSNRSQATLMIRDNERPGSIDAAWHSDLWLPPLAPGEKRYADAQIVTSQPDGKMVLNVTVFDEEVISALYWRILRINPDGSPDPTFAVIDDETDSRGEQRVVAMPDGKILVVGYTSPNQYRLKYRLHSDGNVDASFTIELTGYGFLDVIPLPNGKIMVNGGGGSLLLDGSPIPKLSRLNHDGTLDTTFEAPVGLAEVARVWPTGDGRLLVSGIVGQGAGYTTRLYRLNDDGAFDGGFETGIAGGLPNIIGTVITQADGKLVVGGVFRTFNGEVRNSIVRLNPNGSIDPAYQTGQGFTATGVPGGVDQLWPLSHSRILVGTGGGYGQFDGEPVTGPIILNPDGRRDPAFEGTLFEFIGEPGPLLASGLAGGQLFFSTGYGMGRVNMDLPLCIVSHSLDAAGTTRLTTNALAGRSYTLQASEDLVTWTNLSTQSATSNRMDFTDVPVTAPNKRFHRVRKN